MATYSWVGSAGNFGDASNWQPEGTPGPNDFAIIGVGTGGVTVTAGALQINNELFLNAAMNAASVNVGGKVFVSGSPATLSAGAVTVDGSSASVVVDGSADGQYLPGPPAILNTGALTVGEAGSGTFTEGLGFPNDPSPGSATVSGPLVVGDQAGSDGFVTLEDLTSTLALNGNATIGNAGTGEILAGGGTTLNAGANTITLGSAAGSSGRLFASGTEFDATKPQTLYPGSTLSAAGFIVGDAGRGILGIGQDVQATVSGTIVLGNQATGNGELTVNGGSFTGGGPPTILSVDELVVGNAGVGTVIVSGGGVLDAQSIVTGTSGIADIGIFGGAADIGGVASVGNNTLQVATGALLAAQGLIDSSATGTLSADSCVAAGQTTYALTLNNLGTIEAVGGLLDVHGNVTGDGTAQIGDNATLEIGGTFAEAGTVDFQEMNGGTLVLDDATDFSGALEGLSDGTGSSVAGASTWGDVVIAAGLSVEPQGSGLLIRQSNPKTNFALVSVSMGTLAGSGTISLLSKLGVNANTITQTLAAYPLLKQSMSSIQAEFWNVKTIGSDTLLTYTKGNPIDQAVNGPNARSASKVTGAHVIIGVISGGFDTSQLANDQSIGALPSLVDVMGRGTGDEGRAMAQVIHAIAPGAAIDFYPAQGSLADAIAQLTGAGCSIIVDDIGLYNAANAPAEPNSGGAINDAIDASVEGGVTYVVAAGNDADTTKLPIFGHALNPYAITVAAMNWLAVPAGTRQVGGYLTTQAESFTSVASSSAPGKPDITAADGGPTTLPLASKLNPFFGTSAAAPAVAGVAALMLQASKYQLSPTAIDAIIRTTATPDGVAANIGGAGLINAQAAVAAAAARVRPLVKVSSPGGAGASALAVTPASAGPTVVEADLSQPAGDLNSGATLQVFVTMSSGVTVSGTPALMLNDGGTAVYDANASDPANASLVFDYAPGAETTADLVITGLVANGAIVQDASANPADFSAMFGVQSGLSINSPLHVASVAASQTGEIASGDTIQVSLTLSSGVTVVTTGGAPTIDLNNGATATYDGVLSNPASGTLTFDYVVGSADATPDLSVFDVALPAGTTVQDASGDNADFSEALNQGLGVQVDPSFVNLFGAGGNGAIATGGTAQLSITMTTPVTIDTSGGSPTLTLNDNKTATYDAAASNPASGALVFDNVVAADDQTPDLQINSISLNGATIVDTHGVAVDFSGALDYPTGLTVNSPVAVTEVMSSQSGTIGAGQTVTLNLALNQAATVAAIDNPNGPPTLTLNDGEAASYDAAESTTTSLAFDYVVQTGDYAPDLTITSVNTNGNPIQDALGNNVDFTAAIGAAAGVAVVACFAAGTRIATIGGDVPVEALRIGDRVIRAQGGCERIVSIRNRRIICAQHPRPNMVWPVRVRAHSFGRGLPRRDLYLSPDHALYLDRVLVPVKYLVDGERIEPVPCEAVTYFHVELPRHDVLLAEGLPAESYLDTGEGAELADFASREWEATAYAPLVVAV
jgi:Hint domain/Subtilase family